MTDPIGNLRTAQDTFAAVLAAVTPDQLGAATPCASWSVADVINHVVNGTNAVAAQLRGQAMTGPEDAAGGDYVAAYGTAGAGLLAVFEAEGTMDKVVTLGPRSLPAPAVLGLRTVDVFMHAWDIAKATGQSTDLDATLSEALLESSKAMMTPERRGEDGKAPFGPEQPAPDGASSADRLAAYLGRQVA
jgi:uncharacterized protein (TIGR03086 family)